MINQVFTVIAKSNKGKNRVQAHGDQWKVIQESNKCLCLDDEPAVLMESLRNGYMRWVRLKNDTDFEIIIPKSETKHEDIPS